MCYFIVPLFSYICVASPIYFGLSRHLLIEIIVWRCSVFEPALVNGIASASAGDDSQDSLTVHWPNHVMTTNVQLSLALGAFGSWFIRFWQWGGLCLCVHYRYQGLAITNPLSPTTFTDVHSADLGNFEIIISRDPHLFMLVFDQSDLQLVKYCSFAKLIVD